MTSDQLLELLRACRHPHSVAELAPLARRSINAIDKRLRAWAEEGVLQRRPRSVFRRRFEWEYWVA